MRNAYFKRLGNNEWVSRPFQGWEYRIVKDAAGFHLFFNGEPLHHSHDRVDLLKDAANIHLHDSILANTKQHGIVEVGKSP
jgi:hypothetical protein